jgi:universal stress protein E
VIFQKILVDLDAAAAGTAHPALDAAVQLAIRCKAPLTLVDVVPDMPWWSARRGGLEAIERDLVAYRAEHLAALAASLASSGLQVDSKVLRGRPADALTREVRERGYDLVLRSHGRSSPAQPERFGAIDMQLLRICPCPLWLVGAKPDHQPLRILLALHANPANPIEQRLNRRIVDAACSAAGPAPCTYTAVQAWDAFGEQLLRSRYSREELAVYVEGARLETTAAFEELIAQARERIPGLRAELVRGNPAEVITGIAERDEVDLIVMGTVARTGIQGLVMGNTAESILQRIRCSVLAVKPDGFEPPFATG